MVLYRKYRPQNFEEVIGQEEIVKILSNEIKNDKIAHAYLFSGPRGVGKTTFARILAKAANCLNRKKGESEPCDNCSACKSVAKGQNLDLIEIDAASNRGINEIRELKEMIRFMPTLGRYKIFIIDEAHMLTTEAFNALLKTLEEPPAYAIFILATTQLYKLPETIISRCQNFSFNKIPLEKIVAHLKDIATKEGRKVDEEVLKSIAYRSEGCVRDALSLLGQVLVLTTKEISLKDAEIILPPTCLNLVVDFVEALINKDPKKAFMHIKEAMDKGKEPADFLNEVIVFSRSLILEKIGVLNEHYKLQLDDESNKKLSALAKQSEQKELTKILDELVRAAVSYNYNQIPEMPLELATLVICEK